MPPARLAGVFYAITFATGCAALFLRGTASIAADAIAGASYVIVTLLFYAIFKPVSRKLSLLAALISLAGCAHGVLTALHLVSARFNSLVFFGVYCLLIGSLILRSSFLPRFLGVLMLFAGIGWLTFLSSSLAKPLSPFNMLPGVIGEAALTLWLLIRGVNVNGWRAQVNSWKTA